MGGTLLVEPRVGETSLAEDVEGDRSMGGPTGWEREYDEL